jgi:UDP-glucuronate decarboxylase
MINKSGKPLETELNGRVLLSGGAGFLGSWLSEALVDQKIEVVCVDDLSTGLTDNISNLVRKQRFKFIQQKIEDFHPEGHFDYVLHFASRPSPDDYTIHPIETLTTNSQGTLNMLEIARRSDSIFFLASTSEVYGDAQVIPTSEDYQGLVSPVGLRSSYDEGKRFAEALTMAYHRQYGLDTRVMRIFNVYGPKMRGDGIYGRVIPIFVCNALGNEPLTIHGDGFQTRSFTYVSDWLEATLLMLWRTEAKGQIVNVGSDVETSVMELARLIIKLTDSKSPLRFVPPRPDDPRRRKPDIAKARNLLGWEPKTLLEEGLSECIQWFKSHRDGENE